MNATVTRYTARGGYATRFWAVFVNGELLAVTVYRKGALAVAKAINNQNQESYATTTQDTARTNP